MVKLQGYLACKKQRFPRTLQSDNAYDPMVALVGSKYRMSEVPLYIEAKITNPNL